MFVALDRQVHPAAQRLDLVVHDGAHLRLAHAEVAQAEHVAGLVAFGDEPRRGGVGGEELDHRDVIDTTLAGGRGGGVGAKLGHLFVGDEDLRHLVCLLFDSLLLEPE